MQNTVVSLFLALGIIILAARLAGSLARRLGQPRVLGELIAGVLLGPTVLDLLHTPLFNGAHLDEPIFEMAEIGVLLLMFLVGLEVNLGELVKVGRVAVIAGVLGALIPLALAMPLVMAFGYGWQPALFAGVILSATSVSISAQVLLELGFLKTKEGNALLATALIDDILAILLVSVAVAVTTAAVLPDGSAAPIDGGAILGILLRMTLYIGGAAGVAWFIVPRLVDAFASRPVLAGSYGVEVLGIVLALIFAWSAEALGGVAFITGGFIAGVGISRANERAKHDIEAAISPIAYVFFVPVFFINVGLQTDLRGFPLSALPLAGLLLVIAVISKVGGCGLGGLLGGFNRQEALRLGVCMISRGEVGLIIAALGVSAGVLDTGDALFASLFLVILLTTLIAPILVRQVFPKRAKTGLRIVGET